MSYRFCKDRPSLVRSYRLTSKVTWTLSFCLFSFSVLFFDGNVINRLPWEFPTTKFNLLTIWSLLPKLNFIVFLVKFIVVPPLKNSSRLKFLVVFCPYWLSTSLCVFIKLRTGLVFNCLYQILNLRVLGNFWTTFLFFLFVCLYIPPWCSIGFSKNT